MRNSSFANARWEPSGPTLSLRKSSVAGPFGFLNPTTAIYDIRSNDGPDGTRSALADLTDAERQERAKSKGAIRLILMTKYPCLTIVGRHVLILPRAAPLTSRLQDSSSPHKVLLGILRMFTLFPYWDVSWLVGISFTIGCLIFVAAGIVSWLPLSHPETAFPNEALVLGGVLTFVGAALFQIGAVLLFFESYNDRAETQFGGAMEDLFVNRLGIARRVRNHRPKHFHPASCPQEYLPSNDDTSLTSPENGIQTAPGSSGESGNLTQHVSPDSLQDDDIFTERTWQWWPSWHDVATHYIYEIGFLASFTMSVGATVFSICGILALPGIFNNLSDTALQGAYFFPYLLGGLLFTAASILYILETQPNWYTPQPFKIGWHVGVWNMIGSVGWTLAASFGYVGTCWSDYQRELTLIWASAAFSFGSGLQWYESLDKYVVIIED